eukprot:NODE_9039_length_385_cov_22.139881_g8144_i0.p2 GENE.NODE_9039_length_385_cov_22.139881_g8144_i0~~NODE_9039_length_385_cov_22.139881_g8144_i0.p2  ORF type:complete len:77 (+),score=13.28 NODE_9039_length_385_cov_22.139881_g8144_i0:81-311(+)
MESALKGFICGPSNPPPAHFFLLFPEQKLDDACKLLRILYTADLRDLQDKIDDALIKLQNATGDPRTDTRLGKVGS